MRKILKAEFFNQPGHTVARKLLGKYLVRRQGDQEAAFVITEVELYDGFRDRASHAAKRETKRTAPMFGPAGHLYVYLIYGMYLLLNVTVRERGYPSAILIRAVADINGPGRVGKAVHLTPDLNGQKANRKTGLWFEDRGTRVWPRQIVRTARIGVAYAGPYWSQQRRRYVWVGGGAGGPAGAAR